MSGLGAGGLPGGQPLTIAADEGSTLPPAQIRTGEYTLPACMLSVIGFMHCGGFLLDDTRKVLSCNSIAAHHLGDGLIVRGERLMAMDRESDDRLQSLLGLGSEPPEGPDASAALRRHSRLPLVVRVLRLDAVVRQACNAASLLLVMDPEVRQAPSPDLLCRMFGLTPAEVRIAIGIAGGKSLAEIAADHGLKIGTVRFHSKAVFAKTHTRGQAELAVLLTRLAV